MTFAVHHPRAQSGQNSPLHPTTSENDSEQDLMLFTSATSYPRALCSRRAHEEHGHKASLLACRGQPGVPQAEDITTRVYPTAGSLFPTCQGNATSRFSVLSLEKTDDAASYFSNSLPEWGDWFSCYLSQEHCCVGKRAEGQS